MTVGWADEGSQMLSKESLGVISVALTMVGYFPYFRSIIRRQTKPHLFSWIVWAIVTAIAFAGQYSRGAGPGSWAAGVTAFVCIAIAAMSMVLGEKNITRSDWVAFLMAVAAIPLWYFSEDPLAAVILATLIDVIGFYPTVRKSFINPYQENIFTWSINGVRSLISIFAIERYSFVTMIFPVALLFTNGGIALLLVWRRRVQARIPLADG